jgi:D-beta-D-heptose 7-phosphate kinase/D-beta-D-heptose 1-phosphate adenosyltransferase
MVGYLRGNKLALSPDVGIFIWFIRVMGVSESTGRQTVTETGLEDMTALVESFARARILCVGDIMLDRFVAGAVARISPEAPIPVLRVERETEMLGGVGNVARNVAGFGAEATVLAIVGDDPAGRKIAALVEEDAHITASLVVAPGRPTTQKTRFVSGSQQLLRADMETSDPLSDNAAVRIKAAFEVALPDHDAIILSDYAKGVLSDALLRQLIDAAAAAGKPVIADPKSTDFARYAGVTLLTPNRLELTAASGQACATDDDVVAEARAWIERANLGALLVTRSADGMTLVAGEGDVVHLPAEARDVFDVSGAGDTVVATLALALGTGAQLTAAARAANLAAGVAVGKAGTAVVHAEELVAAAHGDELRASGNKVCALQPALDRIERWRRSGDRIGFTNGCFDLIHPGHISLLTQARAACDRLVVGLNTDQSIARLKGPERPVQNQHARATVLAALGPVDMVVLFADDTPLALIDAMRPDVLVKGADYTVDQVVGGDMVQSYGGQVLLAELTAGHSTTDTIARLSGTKSGSGVGGK